MFLLQEKIIEFEKENWLKQLFFATGINVWILRKIKNWNRKHKYKRITLNSLYTYFKIQRDSFYIENMKKRVKPTESLLWEIFREKRISLGYELYDVAKLIKWDVRQLARFEAWDSLPSYRGYYINELVKLYWFDEETTEKIRWFVCILNDLRSIYRNMTLQEYKPKNKIILNKIQKSHNNINYKMISLFDIYN